MQPRGGTVGQVNALVKHSVGEGRTGRGEQAENAGVTPRCLPGSESHRRIPASCPFPRNPCRQLRATQVSLVASDYRPKTSSCFHHPRLQPGGGAEFYATVPTGLADSHEPTFGLLPDWWKRPMQGSHGRSGLHPPCLPFILKWQTDSYADQNNGLGLKSGLTQRVDYQPQDCLSTFLKPGGEESSSPFQPAGSTPQGNWVSRAG